jgi:hypothetical protein
MRLGKTPAVSAFCPQAALAVAIKDARKKW